MTLARTVPVPVPLLTALLAAATTDRRTDLLTHDAWRASAAHRIAATADRLGCWALFLVDVDRFAGVNTMYGHLAADAVLAGIAETMRSVAGDTASVGRFGGDEFVVLLRSAEPAAAGHLAEVVRHRIAQLPHTVDGPAGPMLIRGVTVPVGVTVDDRPDVEVTHLLSTADTALYRAEQAGGNQVCAAG